MFGKLNCHNLYFNPNIVRKQMNYWKHKFLGVSYRSEVSVIEKELVVLMSPLNIENKHC